MSGNLNAKNPFGNPVVKGNQQNKKPLKNPFANINVQQDDIDNDYQTLNFSNTEPQGNALQSPFTNKIQNDSNAFFSQPMQTHTRKQPFGNNMDTSSSINQRNSANVVPETRRDQGNSSTLNMSGNPGFQGNGGMQQPFYENSLIGSLSTINNYFTGGQDKANQSAQVYDEENEPPLLEDLGIDIELIKMRTLAVLKLQHLDERFAKDADMSGPLLIALALGSCLLLHGKIHFGYIYGFGVIGTFGIYMIMNLLSQHSKAHLYNIMSILGYCLMPVVVLSFLSIFLSLVTWYGFILCAGTVVWATTAATRFFTVLLSLDHQKMLVAYPVLLFYLVFVLITIF